MGVGNTDNEDSKMAPTAEPTQEFPMPLAYHGQPLWNSLDVKFCSVTSELPPSEADEELPRMSPGVPPVGWHQHSSVSCWGP